MYGEMSTQVRVGRQVIFWNSDFNFQVFAIDPGRDPLLNMYGEMSTQVRVGRQVIFRNLYLYFHLFDTDPGKDP